MEESKKEEPKVVRIRYSDRERGWAIDLGNNRYKIDNVPTFSPDLHFGDIIEFEEGADLMSGDFRIVEKGLDQKVFIEYEEIPHIRAFQARCREGRYKDHTTLEGGILPTEDRRGLAMLCHHQSINLEELLQGLEGIHIGSGEIQA